VADIDLGREAEIATGRSGGKFQGSAGGRVGDDDISPKRLKESMPEWDIFIVAEGTG
jgi:hypothetical protein